MKLTVSEIPDEAVHQDLDVQVRLCEAAGDHSAKVHLKVLKIDKRVLVEGLVNVSLKLTCGRCLKEYTSTFDLTFSEEYDPMEEAAVEHYETELNADEMDISFYAGDEIDIDDMITEQVSLAVPMKPLCRAGCMGICPVCGKDLNEGACGCRPDEADPRLAPLKKLKEKMNNRKE